MDKGERDDQMVKQLIKIAKSEGLSYTYRIERIAGRASRIFKIDVKTGKETRVRFADISPIYLAKLERINTISKEESVTNFIYNGILCSIISPKSMILDDIQLNVPDLKQDPRFNISMPKQRIN